MDIHYPTLEEPASSEYVLSVICDMHRQQAQFDGEVDGEAILTFDTTIADWREACDLVGWRQLGQALNTIWGIEASAAQWKAVLEPEHVKRLSDLCEFLAQRVSRPRIRAARLLGRSCVTAGAFLTVRSLLHDAGADASEITPSTLLSPYTRSYTRLFLEGISKLAPGALPPVRISTPVYDAAIWGTLVGVLVLIVGSCAGLPLLAVTGGSILGLFTPSPGLQRLGCYRQAWSSATSEPSVTWPRRCRVFRPDIVSPTTPALACSRAVTNVFVTVPNCIHLKLACKI